MTEVRLDLLLKNLPGIESPSAAVEQFTITGITMDPNCCRPGFLYVADECETVDSNRFGV